MPTRVRHDSTLRITFSTGVTDREPGEEPEGATLRADGAMYKAKRSAKISVEIQTLVHGA